MFHIVLAAAIAVLPSPAFAYIDPGSGSMFLQMAIAAIAAGWVAFKLWWDRIRAFFSGSKTRIASDKDGPTTPK